jgi:hypothetical protein
MKQAANRADFQPTTQRYIPEDKTLHNHGRENLKSYKRTLTTVTVEGTVFPLLNEAPNLQNIRRMEVYLHAFLTLALDGQLRSPRKAPVIDWIG